MTGDLHCHTTLSDGSLGIEEVIVQAKMTLFHHQTERKYLANVMGSRSFLR